MQAPDSHSRGISRPLLRAFGKSGGKPVVYLHGTPGSPTEATLLSTQARDCGIELWAIDRAQVDLKLQGEEYVGFLAEFIHDLGKGERLPILGFSIGAALALRVAARLGEEAGPLFLISAAGPLDLPDAFTGMGAGARIFRSAQARGLTFALAVRTQALIARKAPKVLRHFLFADAHTSDRELAATPAVGEVLEEAFREASRNSGAGYRRDVLCYVQHWTAEIAEVRAPVELWHGCYDNWAPVAMAENIAQRARGACLHLCTGSHYSTLLEAAPAVMSEIGKNASFELEHL